MMPLPCVPVSSSCSLEKERIQRPFARAPDINGERLQRKMGPAGVRGESRRSLSHTVFWSRVCCILPPLGIFEGSRRHPSPELKKEESKDTYCGRIRVSAPLRGLP